MTDTRPYVPRSIRQSRTATWLWQRSPLFTYDLTRTVARFLP